MPTLAFRQCCDGLLAIVQLCLYCFMNFFTVDTWHFTKSSTPLCNYDFLLVKHFSLPHHRDVATMQNSNITALDLNSNSNTTEAVSLD